MIPKATGRSASTATRCDDARAGRAADARLRARASTRTSTQGRGLWLFGEVGTGKTTLAMLVAKAALDAGRSVAIYSMPRLLNEIRAHLRRGLATARTWSCSTASPTVDLLHVDDVGAERSSPWVLEQLYSIVNARYEAERSMTITTNLDLDELAEQIGERTVSRLEGDVRGDPDPRARTTRHGRSERSA